MQSRRDQVQAYFFVVGRMVAAVTHGKPDVLQAPNRRLSTGTTMGFLLAALLVGVFGIIGLFFPGGNTSWNQPGTIVMDKNSGARFVFLDNQLRPVLNYASARLAANNANAIVSVSQSSLDGTPVGQPIGIPGAPDALPDPAKLNSGAWTVCVQQNVDVTEAGRSTVSLLLDRPPAQTVADDQGLLVATPDGDSYLLWQGRRHRIADRTVAQSLGYGDVTPLPVSSAWLTPVMPGRDLAAPGLGGAGEAGPVIDGQQSIVGQVFEVKNPAINSDQLYLVRADGVTPLNHTTEAIVLGARATAAAYPGSQVMPIEVGPGALAGVPKSEGPDLVAGLPETPPEIVAAPRGTVPCARYDAKAPAEAGTAMELRSSADVSAGTVPVAAHTSGTMADRVSIPSGSGVLARGLAAPGAAPGAAFLITDIGVRFPLADAQVMGTLGYSESSVVPMSEQLLDLLPTGPVLSTAAAMQAQSP